MGSHSSLLSEFQAARDSDSKLKMITQRDTDKDTESIVEYTMSLGHRQKQAGADQKASFLLVLGAALQAVKEESHQGLTQL